MSQETYDAMRLAVEAHTADETDGGYISDWIMVGASAHPEKPGETGYHYYSSPDTPPHRLWGLVNMADRRVRRDLDEQ